jgi:hypothetical protein
MDRRRFAGAAALALTGALGAQWSSPFGTMAQTDDAGSTVPEDRCIAVRVVGLRLGESSEVARRGDRVVSVRFAAVEDGRCGVSGDVQCIWAGLATVDVEVDWGGGGAPEAVRLAWVGGDAFHVVVVHQALRLFVVAAGLSGDGGTPPEDHVLDLVILDGWPDRGWGRRT